MSDRVIVFIDIETVPSVPNFSDLSERGKKAWSHKFRNADKSPEEEYAKSASFHAEFSKIVCIGVGYDTADGFKVGVQHSRDERELLDKFLKGIKKLSETKYVWFCAHNAHGFDIPFLCKRILANGLELPESLVLYNKKPWDMPILDTMDMYKFGGRDFASLESIAYMMNIPSSKEDIDGSQVAALYYDKEKDELPRIAQYCKTDVAVLREVYKRITGK